MEVRREIQREYNPAHPNYERWKRARDISQERAQFVNSVISDKINFENLVILDLGSGEGITSNLLSQNNIVVSLEPKQERIKKIQCTPSLNPIMADSLYLPFKDSVFDLIILQDVIEHLIITEKFVEELKNILNRNGAIYLSTPNKFSLFNIISDPHWGIPILCLFNREQVKKYFLKYFRRSDYDRKDIAELLSLRDIITLFEEKFSINICTKYSTEYLLHGGKGLVWSKFHLRLIKLVNAFGLGKLMSALSNDKTGIINKFFTPTFYIVLIKK
jgi:2-polyprenyl-3-methyl-5-hydroxy-6-metoxy-1,4-benzoquinol methylase